MNLNYIDSIIVLNTAWMKIKMFNLMAIVREMLNS